MNMDAIIRARLAAPKNFRVTTTYECGKVRTHDTETVGQAENWATGERHKVGRELTDRDTGKTVKVVAVEITKL